MRGRLTGGCVAALLAVSPLSAKEPAKIQTFHLANGMEVIVISNHRVPAVSHMVWYKVGAADDPPGKSGLTHFHEHVMFLGSRGYKAGDYAATISRHGGDQNAFTSPDATSYYINIAKDKLAMAMAMEADRMRGLTPTDKDVIKEREVILEERRVRVENNPAALLNEQVNAALFRHHPYQRPIIGWMHEMAGLTKEDVLAFHKTWHYPNNAILIISGDVTAAEVRPLAEKYYGALPRGEVPPRQWKQEPPHNAARRVTLRHTNVRQPVWSRTYAVSSLGNSGADKAMPLFLLSQLLGEGKNSRLYKSLVVEQKLATGVESSYNGFALGPAQFDIHVVPEKGIELGTIEAAVDKELTRIAENGFTNDEMTRARTLLKAEALYARDSLTSMARIMGWIRMAGLETDYYTRWPELIEETTARQVTEAAREALRMERSVTAFLLPQEDAP